MTTYKLKKVGRHGFRRVLKNGALGDLIAIPASLRVKADEAAMRSRGEPFVFDIPDTYRKSRARYLGADASRRR